MEAKAIAKGLRVSPIRTRITIDLIRGKNVSEALNILNNTNSKSARLIKKVLDSAIANAVNNNGADAATLYVKEARVDAGPVMKRHWQAKWYANNKDFSKTLERDVKIRNYIDEKLKNASVAKVEIERNAKRCEVVIHSAKPGVIIGHGGEGIEELKKTLSKVAGEEIQITISDIKKADMDAQLVAENIAGQITNRASFRMAQKRAIRNAMKQVYLDV